MIYQRFFSQQDGLKGQKKKDYRGEQKTNGFEFGTQKNTRRKKVRVNSGQNHHRVVHKREPGTFKKN